MSPAGCATTFDGRLVPADERWQDISRAAVPYILADRVEIASKRRVYGGRRVALATEVAQWIPCQGVAPATHVQSRFQY